jgi:mycothione reductase
VTRAPRHHDLVIIGTGSGNSILTAHLDGLDVAIVEHGRFGGTCLNVGCIPTKMYVYPADVVAHSGDARRLGVTGGPLAASWIQVRDRVFGRIDPIVEGGRDYREGQPNVTVYAGSARFVAPKVLDTGTGVVVTADRFVVAAGGRPRGLDVDELREPDPARGVHTSDTVMRMDTLPPRMAVVGGGFIATEFAHVLDAFGVQVTWLHRGSSLLKNEDNAVGQRYTDLARERYDLRLGTTITAASRGGDGVWTLSVTGPDGPARVEVDAVLLAVGRVPNSDVLDATAGGLAQHGDGRIVVDPRQQTSVPGVYALGDICSPYQLKHVANHEARVVAHNLAVDLGRLDAPYEESDHRFVPHAVFGFPQIAAFGPTGHELTARGIPYVAKTQRYGDVAYGWAMEDTEGFLTVYANTLTRRVIAAHCMGYQAATLIQPLIQAATFGQDARDVARRQYWIHPALSEVVENALLGLPFPESSA